MDASTESDETGPRCARRVTGGVGRLGVRKVTVPEYATTHQTIRNRNVCQLAQDIVMFRLYLGIGTGIGEREGQECIRAVLMAQINDGVVRILSHGPAGAKFGPLFADRDPDRGIRIF